MSQENAEIVRGMYQAFNRGDVASAMESLHPDAELHQPPEAPDADSYYGRDEWARGFGLWLSAFDEPRFEPQETTEVRRDRAAWVALFDPELENVPPRDWPESEPIRGSEAVWDFYIEGNEPWEESPFEYVELIDAGNDKVVADTRRAVRGKASGASVVWSYWQVATIRNGKILRIEWFADRADALKAVGLEE